MPPQPVIRRETILFNAIALAMRQLNCFVLRLSAERSRSYHGMCSKLDSF